MLNRGDFETKRDESRSNFPVKEKFLPEKGLLENGVPIQVSVLSSRVFETVELFFICINCGKIYWEGSHYTRVKKFFSDLIDDSDDSRANIYQVTFILPLQFIMFYIICKNSFCHDSSFLSTYNILPELELFRSKMIK